MIEFVVGFVRLHDGLEGFVSLVGFFPPLHVAYDRRIGELFFEVLVFFAYSVEFVAHWIRKSHFGQTDSAPLRRAVGQKRRKGTPFVKKGLRFGTCGLFAGLKQVADLHAFAEFGQRLT